MTKQAIAEHLLIDTTQYKNMDAPWYELHLYDDNTYDSYQKGCKYSNKKPISQNGLQELKNLVKDGSFSTDKNKAAITSLASNNKQVKNAY